MPAAFDQFLNVACSDLGHGDLERRPTIKLGMRRVHEPACLGFVVPHALCQREQPRQLLIGCAPIPLCR